MRFGRIGKYLSSDCVDRDVFFYVRPFSILSSLVAIAERDCMDDELKVCLEISFEARHFRFTVERKNDSMLLKASMLISTCIAYKCGSFLMCSAMCIIIERLIYKLMSFER